MNTNNESQQSPITTERLSALEIAAKLGRPAPTAEQVAIIEAPLEPMLVVAGAGSGKTETMAARVVYLVANGLVRADQVLGLTFTKKAAGELADRVQTRLRQLDTVLNRLEDEDLGQPTVATYNSFAAAVVREYGLWVGVEPGSRLLSEASAWQLATDLVATYAGDLNTEYAVSSVTGHILQLNSQLAEHLRNPEELQNYLDQLANHIKSLGGKPLKEPNEKLVQSLELRGRYLDLVQEFNRRKRAGDYLTFSDQIALGAELAAKVPQIGLTYRAQYKVVLLDEYQDTSHAQVTLLAKLFGNGHPVTAVGDPNQAIYAWRGASASGLTRFPKDFPRSDGSPAPVYNLATTWRNDSAVLAAANQVAEPLRNSALTSLVRVPELTLRPQAGQGEVTAAVLPTDADEAELIADWIAERWQNPALIASWYPPGQAGSVPSNIEAAVLCRARSQFPPIAEALTRRGIPVEMVGLGGLLETPEVLDLVALLHAIADPARGDWMLRLLRGPRVNLGIADLHALGSWATDLARIPTKDDQAKDAQANIVVPDENDGRSLIAALDQLPKAGQAARDGRALSEPARLRLQWLANQLAHLRSLAHLTLPEICALAERALGLDIEVQVATELGTSMAGRANLDAFRTVAADFSRTADSPDLTSFLAWLDAAREQERGLEMPIQDVNKAAVQLITVHAAKGLEWDAVAVPGLVAGNFPSGNFSSGQPNDPAWLFDNGTLPYELRGDRADLPAFDWRGAADHRDLKAKVAEFSQASGHHELNNERRLAYVAYTRARHDLLLTASWWTGENKKPRTLAPFLLELAAANVVNSEEWAPEPDDEAVNPTAGHQDQAIWPPAESEVNIRLRHAAERVIAYQAGADNKGRAPVTTSTTNSHLAELTDLANLLLAERDAEVPQTVQFPARISTSGLVRLAKDREGFARQLRRPVPAQPSVQAHRGTRFHDWVQQHLSPHGAIFELDDLDSADGELADEAALTELKAQFMDSPWATRQPIAIEQEIHTPIAGTTVVARIDAVFPDPDYPGHHLVVDWKTGSPARDQQERQAREVQLAIYRLAWSRYSGQPLDKVSAAFHHVATGETIRPAHLLSEAELEQLITHTGE